MDHTLAVITLSISLAGALITFGMTWGVIKTRQQALQSELDEFKKDIKGEFTELRRDFKLFRQSCSRMCKFAIDSERGGNSFAEFSVEEDTE